MKVFKYPEKKEWPDIVQRPAIEAVSLEKTVRKLLEKVQRRGDKALRKLTRELDGVQLRKIQVTEKEITQAIKLVPEDLKKAIAQAKANIELFHRAQLHQEPVVETMPGIQCWRRSVAIEKVGLYIPGGSAPLFSTVLMLAIPAAIAGCKEIILCTPPAKDGSVHPAILYAAQLSGITAIYKVGGAQAMAAMAYGTETIPQVYKLFGPGNQYVTSAKQLLQQQGVAIDLPAGPSEVCVFADATADAAFVAADLLSQAEHGADSQVLLVTTDAAVLKAVAEEVEQQVAVLPRGELAKAALKKSRAVLVKDETTALELINAYAPEHLILCCNDAGEHAAKIINAGSVFIGHYTPESLGDYASGTNHTLPTNGYAKSYSGVSVDSFVKKITFQQVSKEGLLQIAGAVECMAAAEGLEAHAHAVRIRRERLA
jgi:histidinol dehydrogenase